MGALTNGALGIWDKAPGAVAGGEALREARVFSKPEGRRRQARRRRSLARLRSPFSAPGFVFPLYLRVGRRRWRRLPLKHEEPPGVGNGRVTIRENAFCSVSLSGALPQERCQVFATRT